MADGTDGPGVEEDVLERDAAAWDALVAADPAGSYLQTAAWARANRDRGWRIVRVVARGTEGSIGAQILLHRAPPSPWSRGYAPRGPFAATLDAATVAAFTRAARAAARRHRIGHLLIDPPWREGHPAAGWLATEGWRPADALLINRTRIIDLATEESELWSALRSSARWSVNKAGRSGFTVVEAGVDGLDDFGRMYIATAQRGGFSAAAYREIFHGFDADGAARLLLARSPDGEPIATLMLITSAGRVVELLGASTPEGLRGRANYLLKWEAIRTSRLRGHHSYDMWGVEGGRWAEFKAGFGGEEVAYIGPWELVTDPVGRAVWQAAHAVRSAAGRLPARKWRRASG